MWRLLLRLPRSVLAAVLAVRLVDESSASILPGTFEALRVDVGLTYAQVSYAVMAWALALAALALARRAAKAGRGRRRASTGRLGPTSPSSQDR
jgi:hypothetical protein